jgi:hypothetical protein
VEGGIRLIPPQTGEGVDAESGGEEVGAKTGYRFGVHPASQLHGGQVNCIDCRGVEVSSDHEQAIRWERCGFAPLDEGGTMAQTTAILYTILGVITALGGAGFLIAMIAMAKSSYRD